MNSAPHFPVSRRGLRRARAFTLVELLAVIAIIGILVAILLVTIGRVRQSARDSKCAATIRQFAIATQLYVNDNNGNFPQTAWATGGNYGHYHLIQYFNVSLKQQADRIRMFSCRLDEEQNWVYGLNTFISERRANSITQPARQILATCSTSGWLDGGAMSGSQDYLKRTPKPHSGKVSVVRLDGGVSRERVSTLLYADARRDTPSYAPSDETTYFLGGDSQYDK